MKNERLASSQSAWDCWPCRTLKAVRQYSETRFLTLARKVVFGLQRTPASGIYGDDYGHRTLWDEYCHEVHRGPTPRLESAWAVTMAPYVAHVIEPLRQEEAVILTIGAAWLLDQPDRLQGSDGTGLPVDAGLVQECVKSMLYQIADTRSMVRFDPNCRPRRSHDID